ncbi:MAG: hypothetical protein JXA67_20365 [Micromonosporaceae bacterium]|nr:hypothetical protein [Micromonosporaceae bacterium]
MAGNTVTLQFAGDSASLQRAALRSRAALASVGKAGEDLNRSFGKSTDGIDTKSSRVSTKMARLGDGLVEAFAGASAKLPGILSGAVTSLPPQGQALALALTGGLAASMGPIIGAAVSSGVLLGLGGGVLAAGIAASMKDPAVGKAFDELKEQGRRVFADFGVQFRGPMLRAAKTFTRVLDDLRPAIMRIGEMIAPVIDKLAPALGDFFKNLMPGIEAGVKGSLPLFEVLAKKLPEIGTSLSNFFSTIAEHGPEAAEFFGDLLDTIGWLIEATGEAVGWLTSYYVQMKATWIRIGQTIESFGRWFRDVFWGRWIRGTWDSIIAKGRSFVDWWGNARSRIASVAAAIGTAIASPFRSAFNAIRNMWNSTVGGFSFSIPGWVPGIGGNGFSVPRMHTGGTAPTEMLAILQQGETVIPRGGGGGDMVHVTVQIDSDVLIEATAKGVRRRGGNAQAVLGRG